MCSIWIILSGLKTSFPFAVTSRPMEDYEIDGRSQKYLKNENAICYKGPFGFVEVGDTNEHTLQFSSNYLIPCMISGHHELYQESQLLNQCPYIKRCCWKELQTLSLRVHIARLINSLHICIKKVHLVKFQHGY